MNETNGAGPKTEFGQRVLTYAKDSPILFGLPGRPCPDVLRAAAAPFAGVLDDPVAEIGAWWRSGRAIPGWYLAGEDDRRLYAATACTFLGAAFAADECDSINEKLYSRRVADLRLYDIALSAGGRFGNRPNVVPGWYENWGLITRRLRSDLQGPEGQRVNQADLLQEAMDVPVLVLDDVVPNGDARNDALLYQLLSPARGQVRVICSPLRREDWDRALPGYVSSRLRRLRYLELPA